MYNYIFIIFALAIAKHLSALLSELAQCNKQHTKMRITVRMKKMYMVMIMIIYMMVIMLAGFVDVTPVFCTDV